MCNRLYKSRERNGRFEIEHKLFKTKNHQFKLVVFLYPKIINHPNDQDEEDFFGDDDGGEFLKLSFLFSFWTCGNDVVNNILIHKLIKQSLLIQ